MTASLAADDTGHDLPERSAALAKTAADAIGRAGFDGEIDTHFWARFGGALMLTFIDGAFSTATALASKNGSTSLNFGAGQSAATEALQNTINIAPTLHKFSSVYGLAMRAAQ